METGLLLLSTVMMVAGAEPSSRPADARRPLVAVLDFTVKGRVEKNAGVAAAAQVRDEVNGSGQFTLLDRRLMKERLREIDLALTIPYLDPEALTGFGRTLVAQKIIGGEIASFGKSWTLELIFVDVKTGQTE